MVVRFRLSYSLSRLFPLMSVPNQYQDKALRSTFVDEMYDVRLLVMLDNSVWTGVYVDNSVWTNVCTGV